MKSGTTNTVLTWVLALAVLAGVYFDLRAIFGQKQIRTLQGQIFIRQNDMNRLGLLLGEAARYGKTHPDINPVIEPFETKPAAR